MPAERLFDDIISGSSRHDKLTPTGVSHILAFRREHGVPLPRRRNDDILLKWPAISIIFHFEGDVPSPMAIDFCARKTPLYYIIIDIFVSQTVIILCHTKIARYCFVAVSLLPWSEILISFSPYWAAMDDIYRERNGLNTLIYQSL